MAYASGSSGDSDDDPLPEDNGDDDDSKNDKDGDKEDRDIFAIHNGEVNALEKSVYIINWRIEALQEMMVDLYQTNAILFQGRVGALPHFSMNMRKWMRLAFFTFQLSCNSI